MSNLPSVSNPNSYLEDNIRAIQQLSAKVADRRSVIGAYQNRVLEFTTQEQLESLKNLAKSVSLVYDSILTREISIYTKRLGWIFDRWRTKGKPIYLLTVGPIETINGLHPHRSATYLFLTPEGDLALNRSLWSDMEHYSTNLPAAEHYQQLIKTELNVFGLHAQGSLQKQTISLSVVQEHGAKIEAVLLEALAAARNHLEQEEARLSALQDKNKLNI